MRFGIKAAITAAVAGPAIAALMLTGAGPANAAVTTANAPHSTSDPFFGFCNPFFQHQNQFFFQRQQWNISGDNTVVATLNGNSNTFNYPVDITQRGGCLGGTLSDPLFPTSGPIHGTVFGNHVTFSFTYPNGSAQGKRTFSGFINRRGYVSGTWSETGSENGTGTWHLAMNAHRACHRFEWWNPNRACFLF
ncbi:MAG TPA: hypothetical protein VIX15_05840 [Streptosporangiaceae bacterium]